MKRLITTLCLLIVAAAGYFYYQQVYKVKKLDVWELVPEHALLIYESASPATAYNEILSTKVGNSALMVNSVQEFNTSVQGLDTINKTNGTLGELLKGKFLISFHVITKNKIGVTYYKDLNESTQKESFSKLIDFYKSRDGFSFSTRNYQDKILYELVERESKVIFTYFLEGNIVVGSFTPFLVEDVVRLSEERRVNFRNANNRLFDLPRLSNDEGNVYINTAKIGQFVNLFTEGKNASRIKALGRGSFFDLNVDDKGFYLNGFTEFSTSDFLALFEDQSPRASNLKFYVPNQTAYLLQWSLDKPDIFFNKLQSHLDEQQPELPAKRSELLSKYDVPENMGVDWMAGSIGFAQLESAGDQLVYVEALDLNEGLNQLNTLGEAVANSLGDSVYVERYANYEIRELTVKNFVPYKIMPFMNRTDECYYTALENYVIFSNSIQNLKDLINAIEIENTWGRSVVFNNFLEKTLEEANVSLTLNTERFLTSVERSLDPEWREFFKENKLAIHNFNLASFQASKLDDNFYTSIVVGHNERKEVVAQNFKTLQQVLLSGKAISKPYVVRNHISNLREVAVFDSLNNLNLIANDGQLLWQKPINYPVIGALEQIDYYKNEKLQYFFATGNALHVVDRNGNYVEEFPKMVTGPVAFTRVIDYDNSKRYRFLVADDRGNIRLYDKEGELLEGWNPRKMPAPIATTPFHVRVRRKDCFVVAMTSGQVALLNRRGEYLPGFPLDLGSRLDTKINVKIGSDYSSTIFTTITQDGKRVKFTMEGKVLSSDQLYKPTKDSQFRIVPDELGKGYIIVRKDLNRVVILDEELNELLAKDYFDAENMLIQYYYFSANNKLYAITDGVQGFTYLYNAKGSLVNSRPLDSDFEVGILYSEVRDDLRVYCVSANDFRIVQFN